MGEVLSLARDPLAPPGRRSARSRRGVASPLAAAAHSYARHGIPVFPLRGKDKIPLFPRSEGGQGYKDATTDTRKVLEWWRRYPTANIGMPTGTASGLLVVDIDPRHGGDVSLASFLDEHGLRTAFERTRQISTPTGGRHYYFAIDPAAPAASTASRLGDGIDTRGEGGYVVVPPSLRRDGVYEVINDVRPFEIPDVLLDMLRPKPRVYEAPVEISDRPEHVGTWLGDMASRVATCPPGARNERANAISYYVGMRVGWGWLDEATAHSAMVSAAMQAGLSAREADTVVSHSLASGISQGGAEPPQRTGRGGYAVSYDTGSQRPRTSRSTPRSRTAPDAPRAVSAEVAGGTDRALPPDNARPVVAPQQRHPTREKEGPAMSSPMPWVVWGTITDEPVASRTKQNDVTVRFSLQADDDRLPVMEIRAFRELAEHVKASLPPGTRVQVRGRPQARAYKDRSGEARATLGIIADEIAASLLETQVDIVARPKPEASL
ncbi:MAG: bifunctional DNA primase/polymerase [Actinomycetota bacterium]|nr:bifunctional DNA primase/polymerase [Actinomycetota bacterium]